jgi:hypothetical protein
MIDGQLHCYVGGMTGGHERILAFRLGPEALRLPISMEASPPWLAVDVGTPGSFDDDHVTDPAAAVVTGCVLLYYSALGTGPDAIGLATSTDGVTFNKVPKPILVGRAPEIVVRDGHFFLYFVRVTRVGGYAVHLATSSNGIEFREAHPTPVLDKGAQGSWDSYSVTTPRVFTREGFSYMLYAGDGKSRDDPGAFGLARSRDLVHWSRYAGNPVFRRGHTGAWDDGAIWFGTVFEWNDTLYLFYEGTSHVALGSSADVSAVGVAVCPCAVFDRCMADWRGE